MSRLLNINTLFYYITFLLLIISLTAMVSLFQLGGAVDVILQENFESVLAGEEMAAALDQLHIMMVSMPLEELGENRERIISCHQKFDNGFLRARNNITLAGEEDIIDKIAFNYRKYKALSDELMTAPPERPPPAGFKDELSVYYSDAVEALDHLLNTNHMAMVQADEDARLMARNRAFWMIFLTFLGFISAFYLHNFIKNRFSEPILAMISNLRRVSLGNLQIRLARQKGELDELTILINHLIQKISTGQTDALLYAVGQRNLAAALIEQIPRPVLVFDLRQKLLLSNAKGRALLLGQQRNEVLQRITDFIQNNDDNRLEFDGRMYTLNVAPLFDETQTRIGSFITVEETDELSPE
ncbi:MAG: hypothetical protein JXQ27_15420 [Acidobacteria bacterium]|nr:hypothetical protein [Acidobacteriota bacterium]